MKKDYYAPLGMSSFDFNSLIRARFLDDLIEELVEKGIVHRRGSSGNDGLASVKEEEQAEKQVETLAEAAATTVAANTTATPPVPAVVDVVGIDNAQAPRPASSIYSRDIDGNSYRSASTGQDFSSRAASYGSLMPRLLSSQGSKRSSRASILKPADDDDRFSTAMRIFHHRDNIDNKRACDPNWASVASLAPAPLNMSMSAKCGGFSVGDPVEFGNHSPTAMGMRASFHNDSNSTPSHSSANATDSSRALESQGTSNGSSSSSGRTSLSSPEKSVLSSATSMSDIETLSDIISEDETPWPRRWLSTVKKTFRAASTKTTTAAGSDTPQDVVEKSCGGTSQHLEDEFRTALLDLQQQFKQERYKQQQLELPDLYPDFDHVVELGRLRRKIPSLDFDKTEMVLVASDMTTCMQSPLVQVSAEKAHVDVDLIELAYQKHCQKYFRARLSRRIQCRIARLKLQARHGSVRKTEDWYREVVGVIGWRDEDEARLSWSWRANDHFF